MVQFLIFFPDLKQVLTRAEDTMSLNSASSISLHAPFRAVYDDGHEISDIESVGSEIDRGFEESTPFLDDLTRELSTLRVCESDEVC